jgi:GntR family transcriptional regulator/MocR family aminotransferase
MPRGPLLPLDLLSLDKGGDLPLNRQLYALLRSHILEGRLAPMTMLPATRELAADLSVSRNTVIAAYDALLAEGYIDSKRGSGTWVAKLPRSTGRQRTNGACPVLPRLSKRGAVMATQSAERMTTGRISFHPGIPEIAAFPFATWAKLVAAEMRNVHEDSFGYDLIAGHPRLRTAIAAYLAVSRGVKCSPDQVIVVTGTQAALDLIARMFMDPGDCFQIEDPGYLGAYNAFINAGGRPLPLRVSRDGWQMSDQRERPRLVFVTPSCQWPLGVVMPLDVRLELLRAAEKNDSWIVEDDYDSEYRFRGHPIPAMQGLDDAGRVIYLGTMSKTMFPSLRIAFLVVPSKLAEGFSTAVGVTGQHPPPLLQVALAEFISQGHFATHLRRMRRLYAARQAKFLEICRERLGTWLTLNDADTGMQLIGHLCAAMDDGDILEAAMRRGVDFARLSTQYRHSTPQQGLRFGYAGVPTELAEVGVERLRTTFEQMARSDPQK